jgi:hypothetical protein
MEKKWAADNARIMSQTQAATPAAEPAQLTDKAAPVMEPLVPSDSYDPPEASPAFQVDPAQFAGDPHAPPPLSPPTAVPSDDAAPDAEPHKPGAPA